MMSLKWFTLFGITNSTKDITTLVNVKDETKVKLFNAENPEREHKETISQLHNDVSKSASKRWRSVQGMHSKR